jgi:phospholipase/carboxylesterase
MVAAIWCMFHETRPGRRQSRGARNLALAVVPSYEEPALPMRLQRFADLDVRLSSLESSGPLIVLMHGYGAPPTDLVDLPGSIRLPSRAIFAFPAAPLELPHFGPDARCWWPIDVAALQAEYLAGRGAALWQREPVGLAEARQQVLHMLAELRNHTGVAPERVILGGFSQGAILASDIAFQTEQTLGGLVILSGAPVAEEAWKRGIARRRDLPVFQSHGTLDPILPFDAGDHLRELMMDAGMPVDFVRFLGGHGIGPAVTTGLGRFLAQFAEPQR